MRGDRSAPVLLQQFRGGSVVEFQEEFYYLPEALGNVHLENVENIADYKGLKKFPSKTQALLEGIIKSYEYNEKRTAKLGHFGGYDVVGVEGKLFAIHVDEWEYKSFWLARQLKFGYPISHEELNISLGDEDRRVHLYDNIIALIEGILRARTTTGFVQIISTNLHRLVWDGDRYTAVPTASGESGSAMTGSSIAQFEIFDNILDGLRRIFTDASFV